MFTDEDIKTRLCEYSMGSDRERHLLRADCGLPFWRSVCANRIVVYPHASFTISDSVVRARLGFYTIGTKHSCRPASLGLKIMWIRLIRSIRTENRTTISPLLFPSVTSEAS